MPPEDEHQENDSPRPDAAVKRSTAAAIKAWSDAAYALMKSGLLLIVGAVLIVASVSAIWRDLHQRLINVDLDPQAEQLLLDHGIYFDLRSMLVDEVNQRTYGVNEIVRSSAFENVLPTQNPESVSFKPFGLDISTSEITGMVRNVLGSGPEFVVQIGMMCSPSPCEKADAASSAAQKLTLLVKLQSPARNETLNFQLPGGSLGLRRGLRNAIEKTSEKVLELADPLRASVLYLNEPNSLVFRDQKLRYWEKAAGTTFAPGARAAAGRCLADVVFGCSAIERGDCESGVKTLNQLSAEPGVSPTCRIAAQTDIAIFETENLCPPPDFGAAFAALDGLDNIARPAMSHDEHSRIVTVRLQTEILQSVMNLWQTDLRSRQSGQSRRAAGPPPKSNLYASLIPTFDQLPARVPSDRDNASLHAVVSLLSGLQTLIAPRLDPPTRQALSNAILNLIDRNLHGDSHPRQLFMAQGLARMDTALAALEDQTSQHGSDFHQSQQSTISLNLNAAIIAFQNAAATSSISPLTEPFSDLEPIVMQGDASYLNQDDAGAKAAYAATVRRFTEEDEPLDIELISLAKAAAHWAVILLDAGHCGYAPVKDPQWDAAWMPLGAASDNDLCVLTRPVPPSSAELDKFGMLRVLYPLLAESARHCAENDAPEGESRQAHQLRLMACLKQSGPDAWQNVTKDLAALRSDAVDQEVAESLDRNVANTPAATR
jgi:hypothetical protein